MSKMGAYVLENMCKQCDCLPCQCAEIQEAMLEAKPIISNELDAGVLTAMLNRHFDQGHVYGLNQALALIRTYYMMADADYGFPSFEHIEKKFNQLIKNVDNGSCNY